jgi:hypothetical protein
VPSRRQNVQLTEAEHADHPDDLALPAWGAPRAQAGGYAGDVLPSATPGSPARLLEPGRLRVIGQRRLAAAEGGAVADQKIAEASAAVARLVKS